MTSRAALDLIVQLEDEASAGLDSIATKGGNLGNIAGGLLVGGLLAGGAALAGLGAAAVSTAGNFESTMNSFSSVTGSAVAEAGLSLDDFEQKFLDLGASTAFSAQQAAEAAVALAKGGIPVASIMADATDATLGLAAAGQLELGPAADIVAKQLGVWAETGVTAAQVADQLAQAANASTVDVDELALGLANVGGSAKVAGVDFGDLTQTMALLSPNFSSAADAGTSLKTMLQRLIPTTDPAKAAMKDLGLYALDTERAMALLRTNGFEPMSGSAQDIEAAFSTMIDATTTAKKGTEEHQKALDAALESMSSSVFYDAQGNFVGMAEAAGLLKTATQGLSEEQKSLAFNTIFGSDAIRAAAAIAGAGTEGFNAVGVSMGNAGTAAEQAAKLNQGFAFALDSLKGTLETIGIVIGGALLPGITSFINDGLLPAGNAVLAWVSALLEAQGPLTFVLDSLGPMLPILAALGAMILGLVIPAFVSWATAAWATASANIAALAPILVPLAAIGAAVGLLYMAWQRDFGGIRTTITSFWESTGRPIFEQLRTWLATTLTGALTSLAGFWTGTLQPALSAVWGFVSGSLIPLFAALVDVHLAALGLAVRTGAAIWTNDLQPALSAVWGFLSNNVGPILERVAQVMFPALSTAMGSVASVWTGTLQPAVASLASFFNNNIAPAIAAVSGAISVIVGLLGRMADAIRAMPSLPDMPGVPGFAGGVRHFSGGWAMVGEEGPELVNLPRGANVFSASDTRSMIGTEGAGGDTYHITVDARGATLSEAQIEAAVARALKKRTGSADVLVRTRG